MVCLNSTDYFLIAMSMFMFPPALIVEAFSTGPDPILMVHVNFSMKIVGSEMSILILILIEASHLVIGGEPGRALTKVQGALKVDG